ncbi:MAG TPA: molybdate ABC transporter substrate-binding protein [Geobacterales bacterium]|nr:molybdate ABC transporter substrate-binding protein [Geobacterales bacterium]
MVRLSKRFLGTAWLVVLLVASAVLPLSAAHDPPLVAAAADLQFPLHEIATLFTQETGERVTLTFGSSGNFARQIEQGAPFQLFFSADEGYVRNLAKAGRTVDQGAPYGVGRIVLFVPTGSPIKLDGTLKDLAAAARDGRLMHLAMANPDHAPYGRAAQQALQRQGLWLAVKDRLVLGENAAQATQFALSGSSEAAIIPLSLALSPAVSGKGSYLLLPADLHDPLCQRMVLLKGAGPTARNFYLFIQQPRARMILERYGFTLPRRG